ncbi:alpha/beta hydrolase [Pedobacter frigiditerrae]|uniref:Alpha/beta hydrolase n=1 Tax=Pedobacter frigiditerrae TaxID=2530452 RepID=A0A4R0N3V3_9SPHI|nr:alpha/beta hydrolase [Pedobacter frigiditerrae]TCC94510.1 alpha/beta hydrolase [Pedobacter frigiditerrae]
MKGISKVIGLGFMVLMLFACDKAEEVSYQTKTEAEIILDLSYGTDPKQVMDVYLPPNRTSNMATIILIHGGSFIGGDKSQYTNAAKYLASSGFAVLNVNYRLVDATGVYNLPNPVHKESAVKLKDQVADVSAAVDFAIAHAKQWVISGSRLSIAGHSAGGTLGLLYAYGDKNANKVKAVSNLAGALDLVFTNFSGWQVFPSYIVEGGYRFTGFEISLANETAYKEISPLYFANENKRVPTLNVFPQNNIVEGLPLQDKAIYDKFTDRLHVLKVPNELYYVKGADHAFSKSIHMQEVLDKSVSFFNENLY